MKQCQVEVQKGNIKTLCKDTDFNVTDFLEHLCLFIAFFQKYGALEANLAPSKRRPHKGGRVWRGLEKTSQSPH